MRDGLARNGRRVADGLKKDLSNLLDFIAVLLRGVSMKSTTVDLNFSKNKQRACRVAVIFEILMSTKRNANLS